MTAIVRLFEVDYFAPTANVIITTEISTYLKIKSCR